ncbi:MAG: hypothetical protein J6I98_05115, partial [Clostridia bacterium]|nr:hypothetical protein [Clostridia bacterium]
TSESIRNIGVSDDGSRIFLLTSYSSDTSYGDLYTVDIIDGQIGSASLLDTNVGTRRIFFAEDNRLCYFKYIDTDLVAGDLYIDGEAIDSGVQLYSLTFLEDGSVLYRSDIDFTGSGTLKLYDAEIESLTLADFVSDYLVVSGGRILCLVDEDPEYVTDTLYVWRDDELTFVDDDVLALIPVSDRTVYDLQD